MQYKWMQYNECETMEYIMYIGGVRRLGGVIRDRYNFQEAFKLTATWPSPPPLILFLSLSLSLSTSKSFPQVSMNKSLSQLWVPEQKIQCVRRARQPCFR